MQSQLLRARALKEAQTPSALRRKFQLAVLLLALCWRLGNRRVAANAARAPAGEAHARNQS